MRYVVSIVAFLSTVICVQFALLYFALDSRTALIEENGYQKGLIYQDTIDALQQGQDLGITPSLKQIANDASYLLRVEMLSSNESSLSNELYLSAKYPADQKLDFQSKASNCGEQTYCFSLPQKLTGLWLIEIFSDSSDSAPAVRWQIREVF